MKNKKNKLTSRLRLELRSKAPQASRISATLSGRIVHSEHSSIRTFNDIKFIAETPEMGTGHYQEYQDGDPEKPVSLTSLPIKIKCN